MFLLKNTLEFGKLLKSLDGQKYGAYKRLKGEYAFDKFHLIIDHIQADPYAPPSKVLPKCSVILPISPMNY